ncbi:hypothetical protein HDU85_005599 [Gaertneriomyces sp. JEL0708]|nr:hypothetical protein HDU85_005599 [Gaertneriomyces sp. JEL0708]
MPWKRKLICRACHKPIKEDAGSFRFHLQRECPKWLEDRMQPPPEEVTENPLYEESKVLFCCHICPPKHSGGGRFDGCFGNKYDQARHEWRKHRTYATVCESEDDHPSLDGPSDDAGPLRRRRTRPNRRNFVRRKPRARRGTSTSTKSDSNDIDSPPEATSNRLDDPADVGSPMQPYTYHENATVTYWVNGQSVPAQHASVHERSATLTLLPPSRTSSTMLVKHDSVTEAIRDCQAQHDCDVLRGLWYGRWDLNEVRQASVPVQQAVLMWCANICHAYPDHQDDFEELKNEVDLSFLHDVGQARHIRHLLGIRTTANVPGQPRIDDLDAIESALEARRYFPLPSEPADCTTAREYPLSPYATPLIPSRHLELHLNQTSQEKPATPIPAPSVKIEPDALG